MSRRPLSERFLEKVDIRGRNECWPWIATTNEHGYGGINAGGKNGRLLKAHRVAASLAGMAVEGQQVIHFCDNPPCCNPRHLRVGTMKDNVADMYGRDRSGLIGSRHPLAKLNESSVIRILTLSAQGVSNRELARRFGVSPEMIRKIVQRISWKHVAVAEALMAA
jgi:hypothetical protein